MSTVSGPLSPSTKPGVEAVQVWTKMINDRGGINGHPVKLVTADDGSDPARHRAQVQEMVERDKVIAFVGNNDPLSGAGSVDYHQKVRVPVVGSLGTGDYFYKQTMFFPQHSVADAIMLAFMASFAQQLLPEGKKKLAIVTCHEATECDRADSIWGGGYAAELGFEVVYRARSSVAQPDYTAECLNAQSAGAQGFFVLLETSSVTRLVNSCARQGFKPVFGFGANASAPHQLPYPGMADAAIAGTTFPWFRSDTPPTAEFHAAMRRYLPSVPPNGAHSVGWVAAKLFERAVGQIPEPPTSAAVLEGLWSIKDDDLGGITHKLTFNRDKPTTPRVCWFNIRIRDKQFVAPDGVKSHCRGSY